jgi:hypothetical protein
VPVRGDNVQEATETFSFSLSNSTYGFIGTSNAVGTIVNDDAIPVVNIGDLFVAEPNSPFGVGMGPATFTVSLSNPSIDP